MRHVDAYFEYRQLVGDSDGGRLLDERALVGLELAGWKKELTLAQLWS